MANASQRLSTSTRSRTTTTRSSASSSSRTRQLETPNRRRLRASLPRSMRIPRHQAHSHPLQPTWWPSIPQTIRNSIISQSMEVVSHSKLPWCSNTLTMVSTLITHSLWISSMEPWTHVSAHIKLLAIACNRMETNSRAHTAVDKMAPLISILPSQDRVSHPWMEVRGLSLDTREDLNSMTAMALRMASLITLWARHLRLTTLMIWKDLLPITMRLPRRCWWMTLIISNKRWTVMLTKMSKPRKVFWGFPLKAIPTTPQQRSCSLSKTTAPLLTHRTCNTCMVATMRSSNTNITLLSLPYPRRPDICSINSNSLDSTANMAELIRMAWFSLPSLDNQPSPVTLMVT